MTEDPGDVDRTVLFEYEYTEQNPNGDPLLHRHRFERLRGDELFFVIETYDPKRDRWVEHDVRGVAGMDIPATEGIESGYEAPNDY